MDNCISSLETFSPKQLHSQLKELFFAKVTLPKLNGIQQNPNNFHIKKKKSLFF